MKKDKLTRKDLSFFIIPFLILTLGVGTLTYYTARERVSDVYHMMEKSSLNIASSYTAALLNYQDAYEIAVNLLEDKILVASRAVLLIDNNDSTTESLKKLASELQVDQINLYNKDGEILSSNIEDYVGWKTYEGHPAFYFKNSMLESFIDTVNVDRYFINRITESAEEEIITADVISMAHKIKLTVIAEGVELQEQKEYLEKQHCDVLQGYYISKPLTEEDAIQFLLENLNEKVI